MCFWREIDYNSTHNTKLPNFGPIGGSEISGNFMFKFRKIWQKFKIMQIWSNLHIVLKFHFTNTFRLRIGSENVDVKMETLELKILPTISTNSANISAKNCDLDRVSARSCKKSPFLFFSLLIQNGPASAAPFH